MNTSPLQRFEAYFSEFTISTRRMALLRVLFFGLLAFDLWTIFLPHAPRFGANGFNVSQLPALDPWLPMPTPEVVGPLYVVGGFASLCAALGLGVRRLMPIITFCYGGVYLWSQSDSYQHHYLITLLLVLFCFVPANAWSTRGAALSNPVSLPSWAMRLVYVQVGLTYAWTAVTKTTAPWLDGSTLQSLLTCEARERLHQVGDRFGWSTDAAVRAAAAGVMVGEYMAGLVYLRRSWWVFGLFTIPLFHAGVEYIQLDIELFSYYMFAVNGVLLMPDRWLDAGWVRTAAWVARVRDRLPFGTAESPPLDTTTTRWVAAGAAIVTFVALRALPIAGAELAGVLGALVALIALAPWRSAGAAGAPEAAPTAALAPIWVVLGACLCLVGLQGSEALYDYHRQWAGFLRRSGETAAAIERYEIANAIRSDAPARHVALGRLLLKTGDSAGALAAVDEALRRESLALEAVRARARASGASAEDHLEEGRTHVRIADALAFAAQVYPAAGRASDAAELGRRRSTHLEDARQAFQRNLQLDAVCGEGRSELARLRSKSEGSEP